MPEDAKESSGHGVRAKRSGAISSICSFRGRSSSDQVKPLAIAAALAKAQAELANPEHCGENHSFARQGAL
jgi:hypothetical protein